MASKNSVELSAGTFSSVLGFEEGTIRLISNLVFDPALGMEGCATAIFTIAQETPGLEDKALKTWQNAVSAARAVAAWVDANGAALNIKRTPESLQTELTIQLGLKSYGLTFEDMSAFANGKPSRKAKREAQIKEEKKAILAKVVFHSWGPSPGLDHRLVNPRETREADPDYYGQGGQENHPPDRFGHGKGSAGGGSKDFTRGCRGNH